MGIGSFRPQGGLTQLSPVWLAWFRVTCGFAGASAAELLVPEGGGDVLVLLLRRGAVAAAGPGACVLLLLPGCCVLLLPGRGFFVFLFGPPSAVHSLTLSLIIPTRNALQHTRK